MYIKTLYSDRDGEYTAGQFQQYFKSCSTESKFTVHQYNKIAEHHNQTIVEHKWAILHATTHFYKYLSANTTSHIVWLMKRTSS